MKYDVVYYDTISHPFSRRLVNSRPSGGTELNHVKIVHALADAGYKVLVLNNLPDGEIDGGVVYDHYMNSDVECRTFVACRFSELPKIRLPWGDCVGGNRENPEPTVCADTVIMAMNDQFQEWQRSRYLEGATVVLNSPWHAANFPAEWPKKVVVPALVDDEVYDQGLTNEAVFKHRCVFIYASAVCKGLRPTLQLWKRMKAEHPELKDAELHVTTAGHDVLQPETIASYGAKWIGELTPPELLEKLQRSAGLFFVNVLPETFCVLAAVAEAVGCRCHILALAGGAVSTTVHEPYVTSSEEVFVRDFMASYLANQQPVVQCHNFRTSHVIKQWIDVLGLSEPHHVESKPFGTIYETYQRAAEALRDSTKPDDVLEYANQCALALMPERALDAYRRRAEMGTPGLTMTRMSGSSIAFVEAARLSIQLGLPEDEVRDACIAAVEADLGVAIEFAQHFRARKAWQAMYEVLLAADDQENWQVQDELAIACFYLGKYAEGQRRCQNILRSKIVPADQLNHVKCNLQFHTDAIAAENLKKPISPERAKLFAQFLSNLVSVRHAKNVAPNWKARCDEIVRSALTKPLSDFLVWSGDVDINEYDGSFQKWYDELHADPQWPRWKHLSRKSGEKHHTMASDPDTSPLQIQHAYHLKKYEEWTGDRFADDVDVVVEVGGGYGNFAWMLRKDGFKGRHIIIDLPHVREIQWLFFELRNGNESTDLLVEDGIQEIFRIWSVRKKNPRVAFVATWSLSETPLAFRKKLFPKLHKYCVKYLVATQWGSWGGVDNVAYFEQFMKAAGGEWRTDEVAHQPSRYLCMVRK
jgi:hypothetical protein